MPLTKRYSGQPNDNDLLTLRDWGGYLAPSAVLCVAAKEAKTMRKTLEDLYYGEIRPHDREIDMDSELGKAMGRAERCEEKLTALLEGEAKALLLRLIDADNEISSTLALENFVQGFRLGMKLAMEGLDEAGEVDGA